MIEEDKFSVFIPFEIEKGNSAEGEDKYQNMKFKGIASTTRLGVDSDGETLEVEGMDLDELLSSGVANWHHLWTDKPSAIIGEPTKAEKRNGELYVEGRLYSNSPKAREVYDLAQVLEKDSDTRRLGFSIEGKALTRDPKNKKRILKSRLTGLAITPSPKCKGTKMELLKGWSQDIGYEILKSETDLSGNVTEYLVDSTDENGIRRTVDKALNIKIWKAMEAGDVTGRDTTNQEMTQEPLKQGSLDKDKKKKKKDDKTSFTKGEAILHLVNEGYDIESANNILQVVDLIKQFSK